MLLLSRGAAVLVSACARIQLLACCCFVRRLLGWIFRARFAMSRTRMEHGTNATMAIQCVLHAIGMIQSPEYETVVS